MGFVAAVWHLAQRLLGKLPPAVVALVADAVSLAERALDHNSGAPLDGASKNQLATEIVTAGLEALNAELAKRGQEAVNVDAAELSACITYLVDSAKAVVAGVDAARSKVALSGVSLPSADVVAQAKAVEKAASAQRSAFLK